MRHALFATAAAGFAAVAVAATAWAAPPPAHNAFQVTKEVSDTEAGGGAVIDPDLVNAWGISQAPGGPLWISDNGTSKSTLYDRKTFDKLGLVVNIPAPGGGGGAPTGTVFSSFSGSGAFGGSIFLFVTEDGSIVGWSSGTNATTLVDNSSQGAVYKGLAIATHQGQPRIYAADFALNRVEMYDASLTDVGDFTDPNLPAGYGPFNVQALNNQIFVSFAKHQPGSLDEQDGPHLGFVDVFDTGGHLVKQLVAKDDLNAPWGMVIAPSSFGDFAGALLVGNFGDGHINAYDRSTGAHLGMLKKAGGAAVQIDGLWGLANGPHSTVVFTAGPNDEANGLLGTIAFAGSAP
jgi:uncharacterized protein (TIGR03118 family)